MQIEIFPPGRADWDRWTEPAPFEQSWAYGAAAERFGARVVRARIVVDGKVAGAAQVVQRGLGSLRIGCGVRGIHWRAERVEGAERPLSRAMPGIGPLVLAGNRGLALSGPRRMARLPLDRSLRPGMHQKWRNRLRHAERHDLFVLRERGRPLWLSRVEAAQRRNRRYAALPHSWLLALSAADPGCVETWGAYRDGQPLAGIVMIRHGRVMTYQLGWSGDEGRAVSAHHLLLTRAAEAAQAEGAVAVDLGVIGPDRIAGLTRFKMRAGAEPLAVPALRLVR